MRRKTELVGALIACLSVWCTVSWAEDDGGRETTAGGGTNALPRIALPGVMTSRRPGSRGANLPRGPFSASASFARGLHWLCLVQNDDGSWPVNRPYSTSLAVLAMLRHGCRIDSGDEFSPVLAKGIDWLVGNLQPDGTYVERMPNRLEIPLAALALAEAGAIRPAPDVLDAADGLLKNLRDTHSESHPPQTGSSRQNATALEWLAWADLALSKFETLDRFRETAEIEIRNPHSPFSTFTCQIDDSGWLGPAFRYFRAEMSHLTGSLSFAEWRDLIRPDKSQQEGPFWKVPGIEDDRKFATGFWCDSDSNEADRQSGDYGASFLCDWGDDGDEASETALIARRIRDTSLMLIEAAVFAPTGLVRKTSSVRQTDLSPAPDSAEEKTLGWEAELRAAARSLRAVNPAAWDSFVSIVSNNLQRIHDGGWYRPGYFSGVVLTTISAPYRLVDEVAERTGILYPPEEASRIVRTWFLDNLFTRISSAPPAEQEALLEALFRCWYADEYEWDDFNANRAKRWRADAGLPPAETIHRWVADNPTLARSLRIESALRLPDIHPLAEPTVLRRRALRWLALHQREDGSWPGSDPESATALVLFAMRESAEFVWSGDSGCGESVRRGLDFLSRNLDLKNAGSIRSLPDVALFAL